MRAIIYSLHTDTSMVTHPDTHMHWYTHSHPHTHALTHTRTDTHTPTHALIHTHTHMHWHTHARTHWHTYTHQWSRQYIFSGGGALQRLIPPLLHYTYQVSEEREGREIRYTLGSEYVCWTLIECYTEVNVI